MRTKEEILRRRAKRRTEYKDLATDLDNHDTELHRLQDVADNTPQILDSLEKQFAQKTSLDFTDFKFLFTCIALQCIRIYVINEFTKIEYANKGEKEKALKKLQDKIFEYFNGDSSECNKPYYASMSHIITTSGVPYDATNFEDVNLGIFQGSKNHRFATFAHDPILGLIIGTANILTNTITCRMPGPLPFPISCHVVYNDKGGSPKISSLASTIQTLYAAADRVSDDKSAVVAALIKQIIHIGTDVYTPYGIQLPGANLVLNAIDAQNLTQIISTGDMIKFNASYKMFNLINIIIATLHTLTCKSKKNMAIQLHAVKTQKMLLYSNLIATGSNVIYNAIRMYLGDASAAKKIDFAGLFGIITMLFNNQEFIRQIKEEFVYGQYDAMISERRYKLLSDYDEALNL